MKDISDSAWDEGVGCLLICIGLAIIIIACGIAIGLVPPPWG